jgi:hypothetical protein
MIQVIKSRVARPDLCEGKTQDILKRTKDGRTPLKIPEDKLFSCLFLQH